MLNEYVLLVIIMHLKNVLDKIHNDKEYMRKNHEPCSPGNEAKKWPS